MPPYCCAAVMIRRFEINHAAKRAAFCAGGSAVISCSDFDIQVGCGDKVAGEYG